MNFAAKHKKINILHFPNQRGRADLHGQVPNLVELANPLYGAIRDRMQKVQEPIQATTS